MECSTPESLREKLGHGSKSNSLSRSIIMGVLKIDHEHAQLSQPRLTTSEVDDAKIDIESRVHAEERPVSLKLRDKYVEEERRGINGEGLIMFIEGGKAARNLSYADAHKGSHTQASRSSIHADS